MDIGYAKKQRTSTDSIIMPSEKNRDKDSMGNRSSIMRTPDSPELIGCSNDYQPDLEEIRAR